MEAANASELAEIASELGADVLSCALRYPSDMGGWQLGDLDLGEYLDRYRNQRLVLIIAPTGEARPATYICGICGFAYYERGECPRCKMGVVVEAGDLGQNGEGFLQEVRELLDKFDGEPRGSEE
jgi:hypothetical protein